MFAGLVIREAIVSTSLSHPEDVEHRKACDICRAAGGDVDAMRRVWIQVSDELDRRNRL